MNEFTSSIQANASAEEVWWLVQVRGDLTLSALHQAAAGYATHRSASHAGSVAALVERCVAVLSTAPDLMAQTPDRPALTAAAEALLSLGGLWYCAALPWAPMAQDAARLPMDSRLRLCPVPGIPLRLQPDAVAMLLALGSFDTTLPSLVSPRPGLPDGQPSAGTVNLVQLAALGEASVQSLLAAALHDIGALEDQVVVIRFDIDDQSPEDLAVGLDRLRAMRGVLSATWTLGGGKKGRPAFCIEVLAQPKVAADAILTSLRETGTIGLRWRLERRVLLARHADLATSDDGRTGRIKTVVRPGGQCTTKAESDDIARLGGDLADRTALRAVLESRRNTRLL